MNKIILLILILIIPLWSQTKKVETDTLKTRAAFKIRRSGIWYDRTTFFDYLNSGNQLQTNGIANEAITGVKISPNAITTDKIQNFTITSIDIALKGIDSISYNDKSIWANKLRGTTDGFVPLSDALGNVTWSQINMNSVSPNTIYNNMITDDAITTSKILDSSVTRPKLSTTVNILLGTGSGSGYPPDDATIEFHIVGDDTSIKIKSVPGAMLAESAKDTIGAIISDSIKVFNDTTAIKSASISDGRFCYLKQLSSTNSNGGRFFVQGDSVFPEGVIAFNNAINGKQWTSINWLQKKEINVFEGGAQGDGSTDDYSAIQRCLNVTGVRDVILGNTIADTFIVSKPIQPNSNTRLILNGVLKIKNATTYNLIQDALAGDYSIQVSNASSYFSAGDWVIFGDTTGAIQGGYSGQTRKVYNAGYVSSVVGNVISFTDTIRWDCYMDSQATVAKMPSAILLYSKTDVVIEGRGIVLGNNANQFDAQPMGIAWGSYINGAEENRMGCGISVVNGKRITIKDIILKNAISHNLHFKSSDSIKVDNIRAYASHDKNTVFWYSNDITVSNSSFMYGDFEDGLTFYKLNNNVSVANCRFIDNGRFGFNFGQTSTNLRMDNCYFEGNGRNFYSYTGIGMLISNCYFKKHRGYYRYVPATPTYSTVLEYNAHNNSFVNCIWDTDTTGYGLITVRGNCLNNSFIGGTIKGTSQNPNAGHGLALTEQSGNAPSRTKISNVTFSDCKEALFVNSLADSSLVNFCTFTGNTVDVDNDAGADAIFIENNGYTTRNSGEALIPLDSIYTIVTHGCNEVLRKNINVVPISNIGASNKYWVSHVTDATFRINLDAASNAFTENDANVIGLWQADDTSNFTYRTGSALDYISRWDDVSDSSNHLLQTSESAQPNHDQDSLRVSFADLSTDYLIDDNNTGVLAHTNDYTIEGLIKTGNSLTGTKIILKHRNTSGFQLYLSNNLLSFIFDWGAAQATSSTHTVTANTAYWFAATVDRDDSMRVFITDTSIVDPQVCLAGDAVDMNETNDLLMGLFSTSAFDGYVYEIRISNKQRSKLELELYRQYLVNRYINLIEGRFSWRIEP